MGGKPVVDPVMTEEREGRQEAGGWRGVPETTLALAAGPQERSVSRVWCCEAGTSPGAAVRPAADSSQPGHSGL